MIPAPPPDRNLEQLNQRRRRSGPRKPLHPTFPRLPRAQADRAHAPSRPPADAQPVHDRARRGGDAPPLPGAAAAAVDEIIIVDTGSIDRTVEIARSYGAQVIEREWTGSFSEARNVSFEAATGDWIMYLDADEVLVADDVKRLRALTGRTWREAFYLVETSYTGDARRRRAPSPTARCGSSATAPTTASTAGCTSRSPTTCPPTRRAASSRARSGSSTTDTLAPSATPRRSRAATSSCCGPAVRERAVRLPALQHRHRVRGDRRPPPCAG